MPKSVFKRSIALLLAAALVSGGVPGDAAGNTESGKAAVAGVSEYTEYTAENAAVPNAKSAGFCQFFSLSLKTEWRLLYY